MNNNPTSESMSSASDQTFSVPDSNGIVTCNICGYEVLEHEKHHSCIGHLLTLLHRDVNSQTATAASATATPATEGSASQNLLEALKETHRHIERLREIGVWNNEPSLGNAVVYANQLRAQILALNSHPWSK